MSQLRQTCLVTLRGRTSGATTLCARAPPQEHLEKSLFSPYYFIQQLQCRSTERATEKQQQSSYLLALKNKRILKSRSTKIRKKIHLENLFGKKNHLEKTENSGYSRLKSRHLY